MLDVIKGFFSTKGFMPHGMCLFWKPSVLWTLVVSNAVIALSYLLIPTILLIVYSKRKDIRYTWIFLLFAAFILLCGATHALHVVTYWNPIYGAQGLVDALTALVSFATAIVLWRLVPDLLKLPTPEAYRVSEQKYKTLVESVQHGICTFDANFKINFINSMGSSILEQVQAQLIGSDVRKIFNLDKLTLDEIRKGKHQESIIYTVQKQKIVDYHVTPLETAKENEQFLLSFSDITIFKDISNWDTSSDVLTRTKRARDRLIESQKLESLGQFAGGVAHDFNNALAVISGSLEISHDLARKEDKALHQQLSVAEKAVKSSAELIEQLLIFSRNKEHHQLQKAINLSDILEKANLFGKTIFNYKTECHIEGQEDLWPIQGNENQLLQLLTNLLTNARDALPKKGGKIEITAKNIVIERERSEAHQLQKPGAYVQLTCSDTGSGIAQKNIKHLFTPFFTTKPVGQGTGLGLAVVYGIVINHGGEIFVDSTINQGTTFTIYFPKIQLNQEEALEAAFPPKVKKKKTNLIKGKHILIADDEEALRDIISAYFLSCDAKLHFAEDGLEAIKLFEQLKANLSLIVLDARMPGLDGVAVYQKIREVSKTLPVLFMSGDAMLPEDLKGDINVAWLSKPFMKADLLEAAQRLLDATSN